MTKNLNSQNAVMGYMITIPSLSPLQNKLMKHFSRQLIHKHQHLHQHPIRDEDIATDVERQLDALISLNMFLMTTGIEQRSAKVCAFIITIDKQSISL